MNEQKTTQILVVEDDEELAGLIRDYLTNKHFAVEIHASGEGAEERILQGDFNLVILDLMLPVKDGIAICRGVRQDFQGAILMLTASNDSVDQILGLEIGADDYVQKPVEPRVLLARINALLRRFHTPTAPDDEQPVQQGADRLNFGNLSINRSARTVSLGGKALEFTNPEYEVLLHLAENAGQIIARDQLFKHVKNFDYDGQSRFIDITISQIRKHLRGSADAYLKTVRGKGYLFTQLPD